MFPGIRYLFVFSDDDQVASPEVVRSIVMGIARRGLSSDLRLLNIQPEIDGVRLLSRAIIAWIFAGQLRFQKRVSCRGPSMCGTCSSTRIKWSRQCGSSSQRASRMAGRQARGSRTPEPWMGNGRGEGRRGRG